MPVLKNSKIPLCPNSIQNNIITASYECVKYTENGISKEVCLKGGDSAYFESNIATLKGVESYFNTLSDNSGYGSCRFLDSYSYCTSDSLGLNAYSHGGVTSSDGSCGCNVSFGVYVDSYCDE